MQKWVVVCLLVSVSSVLLWRAISNDGSRPAAQAAAAAVVKLTHMSLTDDPFPGATAPYWETPFILWNESHKYLNQDPKLHAQPTKLELTMGLLRFVSHERATFWARNPSGPVRVFLLKAPLPAMGTPFRDWPSASLNDSWTQQTAPTPSNATDFTAVIHFTGLPPSSVLGYLMQLSINGTWFNHINGTLNTFPEPGTLIKDNAPLVFGFGSCINPYKGTPASGNSLRLLAELGSKLSFFLFIGDFIYFWDELPHEPEEYLAFYRKKLRTREVALAMRAQPWIFQFDDHEVHNDWAGEGLAHKHPYYKNAFGPYDAMLGNANPPKPTLPGVPQSEMEPIRWYTMTYGNANFFVADTRTYKVNTQDLTGPLLGERQLGALKEWVRTHCRRDQLHWCFLVSPTMFTHASYRKDLWYGSMKEQQEVVKLLTQPGTAPVTILSGDSHVSGGWQIAPDVVEMACSPVDAFGLMFPWSMPPRYRKYRRGQKRSREFWPALGDLPPTTPFFRGFPRHLGPAGYTCLVEVSTSGTPDATTVSSRLDLIDGHRGVLIHSHKMNYTHARKQP